MPILKIENKEFLVDDQGFLRSPEIWDAEVANLFALAQGMTALDDDHWKVINIIRKFYLEHGNAPMIRFLCKATGFTLRELFRLFPDGPAQGACKIAGLPKPDGCV